MPWALRCVVVKDVVVGSGLGRENKKEEESGWEIDEERVLPKLFLLSDMVGPSAELWGWVSGLV